MPGNKKEATPHYVRAHEKHKEFNVSIREQRRLAIQRRRENTANRLKEIAERNAKR